MSLQRPAGGLLAVLVLSILALPPAQAPASATFGWGDAYELPAGAVVPKDLYVVANEATIDGTVEGDLAVVARRVELTGTAKGNTNLVAARIEITGRPLGIVRTGGTVGAAQIIPPPPLPGPMPPAPPAPLPATGPPPRPRAPRQALRPRPRLHRPWIDRLHDGIRHGLAGRAFEDGRLTTERCPM
jgi:hypothetical protein